MRTERKSGFLGFIAAMGAATGQTPGFVHAQIFFGKGNGFAVCNAFSQLGRNLKNRSAAGGTHKILFIPFEQGKKEKHQISIGHEGFECSVLPTSRTGKHLTKGFKILATIHDSTDKKHGQTSLQIKFVLL